MNPVNPINQSIADTLNAKKIPTRKGAQWSRSVVRTIIIRENKLNP
ncbi:MAG: recombinase family protein [Bacteriovorax sp.]|nr:recombinase family protein [Bacteriovorax sp.]